MNGIDPRRALAALALCGAVAAASAAPMALNTAVTGLLEFEPARYIQAGQPAQGSFDIAAWARQRLGTDRFTVQSAELQLRFADDADPLQDQGLLGYDGAETLRTGAYVQRDGRRQDAAADKLHQLITKTINRNAQTSVLGHSPLSDNSREHMLIFLIKRSSGASCDPFQARRADREEAVSGVPAHHHPGGG